MFLVLIDSRSTLVGVRLGRVSLNTSKFEVSRQSTIDTVVHDVYFVFGFNGVIQSFVSTTIFVDPPPRRSVCLFQFFG